MDRREHRTEGFTLVELVVVVAVIGALLAIVAPTLLGARARADARASEALVHDALLAAKSTDQDGYAAVTLTELTRTEPAVHFVDGSTVASSDHHEVSVAVGTSGGDDYVVLASRSHDGGCYAIEDRERSTVGYQRTGGSACDADAFDPTHGWSDIWP